MFPLLRRLDITALAILPISEEHPKSWRRKRHWALGVLRVQAPRHSVTTFRIIADDAARLECTELIRRHCS